MQVLENTQGEWSPVVLYPVHYECTAEFSGRRVCSPANTTPRLSSANITQYDALPVMKNNASRVIKSKSRVIKKTENEKACQLLGTSLEKLASMDWYEFSRAMKDSGATSDDMELLKRCRKRLKNNRSAVLSKSRKKECHQTIASKARELEEQNAKLKMRLCEIKQECHRLELAMSTYGKPQIEGQFMDVIPE